MKRKSNEPRLTHKQICNQLRFSDSTIKRYRHDFNMDSPCNENKHRKKNNKPNSRYPKLIQQMKKLKILKLLKIV